MFNKLKSHLYALQILEYDADKFLDWVLKNPGFYPQPQKGKLGLSAKTKFLYITSVLLLFIIPVSLGAIILNKQRSLPLYGLSFTVFLVSFIVVAMIPFIPLTLSLFLLKPVEQVLRFYLLRKTESKIKSLNNLKVVGITGSYGKTSVKHLLAQILAVKYDVVATPESHNKLVSVARTVLSKVSPKTEVLIVEMGAYKTGEIKQICKMVKPQIGIITGITTQHLERFKNLENIKRAKFELIESLPSDGYAVFNLDNPDTRELYEKCQIKKDGYSVSKTVVQAGNRETSFELFGNRITTPLLGHHNVLNIMAAVVVAKHLGLSDQEILTALKSIKPIPHRLEIVSDPSDSNSLIIDDAYSSNVEGYKAAFELIRNLKYYPKILVTPGLVELGEDQHRENFQMAKVASEIFDFAVVTNAENSEALVSGFVDRGWTKSNAHAYEEKEMWIRRHEGLEKDKVVFPVKSLKQATDEVIPIVAQRSFLILFENDLPDIYR